MGIFLKGHLHFEINIILKKIKQTEKPEKYKGRLFVFKLVSPAEQGFVCFLDHLSKNKYSNPVPLLHSSQGVIKASPDRILHSVCQASFFDLSLT